MLTDARTISKDEIISADVAVVGAGVSGMSMALEFADAPFSTCLIESGGLKPDKIHQSLNWGENVGLPYYPLDTTRARMYGGTTHFWKIKLPDSGMGARVQPMDAIDFEEREWVPHSGWPFDKAHLDPFYERANGVCGIGPYNYDPAFWTSDGRSVMPFAGTRVRTSIFQFTDRKEFHLRHGEKIKNAENIKTLLHANVTDIRTDESGRNVTGLQVDCLDGNRFLVQAQLYILALGGIETPRLLLSSNGTLNKGIGNQHDLVGRFFMEHPHLWSGSFIPATLKISHDTFLYQLHRKGGVPILAKIALSEETMRMEQLVNYCVSIHPDYRLSYKYYLSGDSAAVASFRELREAWGKRKIPPDFLRHLRSVITDTGAIRRAAYRKLRGKFKHEFSRFEQLAVYSLNHMSEQIPNPDSRVVLSEKTDTFGMRRANLNWQLSPLDIYTITRAQEIISSELQLSGLGRLNIQSRRDAVPHNIHGGWHHMGTTRMHPDPRKGVVDQNCRVHGMSNLFIAGASVFPTGGVANPVLTTIAMVLRLADHLKHIIADK
ncbi:MAG: GMC family oxidoreductase [Desulfobacteraceae bacterium]|nr:GMC family oxidoreductase [Desulfobacteraceae bacterium]